MAHPRICGLDGLAGCSNKNLEPRGGTEAPVIGRFRPRLEAEAIIARWLEWLQELGAGINELKVQLLLVRDANSDFCRSDLP